jgi:hypothetical protein
MILQGTTELYDIKEVINILETTDKLVLSMDYWYLQSNNNYMEDTMYDFSDNPVSAKLALKWLIEYLVENPIDKVSLILAD